MKDIKITISKRRQRTELLILLVCFIIAFGLNVYAIMAFDGKWSEMFWSLGFVVSAALFIYAVLAIIRIIIHFIRKTVTKTK